MSVITHDRLPSNVQSSIFSARQRAAIRTMLKRSAGMLLGAVFLFAVVAAIVGLKAFIVMSQMPLVH